jgi:hypothetical protein
MEIRTLTPEKSKQIVELLIDGRGWTVARIARTTNTTTDFVRRVQAAKQNFEERDVEALAKAAGQDTYRLLFDSVQVEALTPEQRKLYELAKKEVARHEAFERVLRRKPAVKKRRAGTTKAA